MSSCVYSSPSSTFLSQARPPMSEFSDPQAGGTLRTTPIPRTAADVIGALENDPGLSPDRRRDLISAVKCFCTMLDRDPAAVVVDPATLRRALAGISPARFGISPRTWQNRKSNIAAALRRA